MTHPSDVDSDTITSHPPPPEPTPTKDFGFLPIPSSCRYNPDNPVHFGYVRIIVFGLASTFRMNLYYCQPLLVQLALAFRVSDSEVSRIPALIQAGYAIGLVLLSPLGDIVRRRQLLLLFMTLTSALSIGLAITNSLPAFEALSFIVGTLSVTPQILIPLTADLAPPARRASSISIVLAGLLMGVLLARVLAGIIAQFSSYKNVYWMGVGGQFLLLIALYIFCPDTPPKNKNLGYLSILFTMAKLAVTEPLLIQACLVSVASAAVFSSFWVTMTFLLSGAPYHYNTLDIGLFGLVGMVGVGTAPFIGRLIDALIPWMATVIATIMILVSQGVQFGGSTISIGAVIVATFLLDVGRQSQQVSLTTAVYSISLEARARLNAVLILSIFLGQVMGTAVGTQVFLAHGSRAATGLNLAWCGWQLVLLFIRGPHCSRHTWFGWEGGAELRKAAAETHTQKAETPEMPVSTNGSEGMATPVPDLEKGVD
ncbi:major facilitator superfamily domain-containing protein [Hysterangium stoloniferum]|nr:major facilitator superfamily domain-containing protein [Hysterangium stoloniferum]